MIFCGSGSTAAINRLVDVLHLRLPADLDDRWDLRRHIPADRAAGRVHRPLRAPHQRAAVAGVDRRRRHHPRGSRRPDRPGAARRRARAVRRAPAQDRQLLGRLQRHRHRLEHGARSRGCSTSTARCPSATSPPPRRTSRSRWTRADDPLAYKDAVFISPHKFIGGPGTPGVLVARRELFRNRVPSMPGGGTVAYVNPIEHVYLADIEHREEGGTPGDRGVDPRRASCSSSRRPWAWTRSGSARRTSSTAPSTAGRPTPPSRSSAATRRSGCRSSRSSSGTGGRYLHHNFVVALLNDLFGIQSRGGCSCAGPYGHRLLGIDLETTPRVRARDHPRLRGDQARLGAGQLQLLHQRGGVRVHPRRGGPRRVRGLAAAAGLRVRRGDGAVAPSRRPAGAAALACTTSATTAGRWPGPRTAIASPSRRLAAYLDEARDLLARPPAPVGAPTIPDGAVGPDFETLRWFLLPEDVSPIRADALDAGALDEGALGGGPPGG